MNLKVYKYHGAGNDFLLCDNRDDSFDSLSPDDIRNLCNRHKGIGADGLIILDRSGKGDFSMRFYNNDASGGVMCGNGGRCVVAFAKDLGIIGSDCSFMSSDGLHSASVLASEGNTKTVRLQINPANGYQPLPMGYFLDTGTKHLVVFKDSIFDMDVVGEGRVLRNMQYFAPTGTNVNFVKITGDHSIAIRTYEKGVEDETLACGTGISAAAIALCIREDYPDGKHLIKVRALEDDLQVEVTRQGDSFPEVFLTGPAEKVGEITVALH